MTGAILLLTFGGLMIVSALKGISIPDVLSGAGDALNPAGGKTTPVSNDLASGVNSIGDALVSTVSGGAWGTMQNEMSRMSALNQPYKWGGGHSGWSPNGPWDCSGAVSQVLHTAGLLDSPKTSTGLMLWGHAGKGADFTVYSNPSHVFIIAESGPHAGMAWGTTNSVGRGGPAWHHHTTAGFVARRP